MSTTNPLPYLYREGTCGMFLEAKEKKYAKNYYLCNLFVSSIVKQTKNGKNIKNRKDMRKSLIAIAMVLTLSMTTDAVAQKHRHTPRTEQVDSTKSNDAIEAFSDTTSVAEDEEDDTYVNSRHVTVTTDEDAYGFFRAMFSNAESDVFFGMAAVLGIIFILFVLFPIIVIIGVVYLINRNRKEKYKLAQMAMQNGQPIPDELLKDKNVIGDSDDYHTGIRQMFMGVGLAIFLGIVAGKAGFGIGALVFFIGLGKWYISKNSGTIKSDSRSADNYNNFNNNQNIQNND